ncbi:hypothetical protein [Anaeromyxobacter sp. Fw109-5]|uniref:hypothetical protein n=1 Tax=Anaeromyxobacter sp. (strain Fw109-5) TaxID=404589 RepID=UPI0000ED7941|nr:hypothetical protein [Anaeromyxobacter sp. Fw109-5]ABS24524.1 conserved hypothetical protein [Anaeromyxobacter sp. Fw109-5]
MNDLLRFLHILSASAWLGATLWVAGDVRRTLAAGRPFPAGLAARVNPAIGLDVAMAVATILTGLLVLAFQGVHPRTGIMVGFALSIVRVVVVLAGLRPAWRAVATRLAAGQDVPPTDSPVKRMAMWSGMAHTLWLIALATMVFPV